MFGFNMNMGMGGNGGNHGHGHGHHGHGHHGHHNNHHNEGFSNQGFSVNQGFNQASWTPVQGAHYRIVSGLSNKMVLDVSQDQHTRNSMILYEWHNSQNQKFYFQSAGGNKWGIFSVHSNQTVEIPNGSGVNGTHVVSSQPNMQANEMWELVPANFMGMKNAFYLKGCSGKYLDVYGAECKNHAHICIWDYNGNNNQIWVIEQI